MMRRLAILGLVIGALAMAPNAEAVPIYMLSLTSGATTLNIGDGAALDMNPAAGVVTYIGPVGPKWTVNVTTGQAGTNPLLDLNSVDTTSAAGALPLSLTWSATDFSGPIGGFSSAVGGTIQNGGGLTFQAWADGGNVLNGMAGPIGALQAFGPVAFSGTVFGGPAIPAGLYSLTERAVLTSTSRGTTSFNAAVSAVPEPGSMMLLGTGLIGLAGAVRRRMKK